MNTCCGGKPARFCSRLNRCGAASEGRSAQAFHFRSGGASQARCPKSPGDHSRDLGRLRSPEMIPARRVGSPTCLVPRRGTARSGRAIRSRRCRSRSTAIFSTNRRIDSRIDLNQHRRGLFLQPRSNHAYALVFLPLVQIAVKSGQAAVKERE
jgi:hypothetical protein